MFRIVAVSVAAALILSGAPVVHASDADIIREARDRADIDVLFRRYVQALDDSDVNAYPTFIVMFSSDGGERPQ